MKKINKDELMKISGGGFSIGVGLFFGGVISFFIGFISGYVRPLACN